MLKAAILVNNAQHQQQHASAMADGLSVHQIASTLLPFNQLDESADFHVIWSIKRPQVWEWRRRTGRPVLVMERGHLQDRMRFTSCGWNGLGNRGSYPLAADDGKRWRMYFSHLLADWKKPGNGHALLIGQVPGDAALYNLRSGFEEWARRTAEFLHLRGWSVVYRPHPLIARTNSKFCPASASLSKSTLADDLARAEVCITFNSTTGVEAVLAGIPTVTLDIGAIAWPVASHTLSHLIERPDRTSWIHNLAWTSWTLDEIRRGEAWEALDLVRKELLENRRIELCDTVPS